MGGHLGCRQTSPRPVTPMQTVRFLHAALAQALPTVHSRRLNALMCTVAALLQGRRLTLTGLGRSMPGTAYPKHAIKRVDRLIGNAHLQAERSLFYWAMLRALLGSLKHPLILVDWSPIDAPGNYFLLRAAIPLAGRSFPIYESIHDREGCPKCQARLLQALAVMLPEDCMPILVADAGFRRPWFKAVEAQGWYYVGRVRNRDLYRVGAQSWQSVKALYAHRGTGTATSSMMTVVPVARAEPTEGNSPWRIAHNWVNSSGRSVNWNGSRVWISASAAVMVST